ncbi:unnamed protein product [Peniophora sp. CBMAI 1063]|nr:unnamed protein product [Peniophora sp. CBMAI 1063]
MAARLAPRTTPRSSLSLTAPIRNPYDAFNASDFDSWIGGLTSSLRKALDHDDELEDEDAGKDKQKSVTGALEAARGADETMTEGGKDESMGEDEEESEESVDEGVEDSFAHVNAVSARAKGKARDPRDGPGFGSSSTAPIELLESDEEEEEGEEDEDEEGDSDEYEYDEEEEESWDEDDESEEDLNAPGSSKSHIERARRASEGDLYDEEEEEEEEEEEDEAEDDEGDAAPAQFPHDLTAEDEDEQDGEGQDEIDADVDAPELPDPWAPARTFAEDYYSGGDAPVRGGSPHNLTPRLRAVSPGLHPAPSPAQAEVINVDDSDEEDQVQEEHSSDRWDWNNPPAVPWGHRATRPGHLISKESEEDLELQYPDEDEDGAEDDYEGEEGAEYADDDEGGDGEEGEEDVQAVKDRQKGMFVSAADVYSERGDEHDDDEDAEADSSPLSVKYRQDGSSLRAEDVYGDNNAGLLNNADSDGDSDIVEISPPRRKAAVSPMPQDKQPTDPEADEEVLANPFGLPSSSAPAPAPVPALSTAQASASLNAAPALPLGTTDSPTAQHPEDVERVDPASLAPAPAPSTSTSALDTLASVAAPPSPPPAGFSLVPATWTSTSDAGAAASRVGEEEEYDEDEFSDTSLELDEEDERNAAAAAAAAAQAQAQAEEERRAQSVDEDEFSDTSLELDEEDERNAAAAAAAAAAAQASAQAQVQRAAEESIDEDEFSDTSLELDEEDERNAAAAAAAAAQAEAQAAEERRAQSIDEDEFSDTSLELDEEDERNAALAAAAAQAQSTLPPTAQGPAPAQQRSAEEELRAQLGPGVVLAGEGAPSIFGDGDEGMGMYTDPGAPAYVPETPAAAPPTKVEEDPLETTAPDVENEAVAMDDDKEDDGMYTDPGAPAPLGEGAPMGYSAEPSPVAPSPAYIVEEPEAAASPARTAREESVAVADGTVDKAFVVEDDEEADEVESVVSPAEVEEPGEGEVKEPGLSPVEEEEEDELPDDTSVAQVEPPQDDHVPPPVMPYIPPVAARAIGEDVFGRPGMPFAAPKSTTANGTSMPRRVASGLFTPKSEASGLFTPLEGSDASTSPKDQSREDSPTVERPHSPVVEQRPPSPVVERHHDQHSPTPAEKEEMRAAMREVERGAHEVYVGADEDDGEDAPSPALPKESAEHVAQEPGLEQQEPQLAPEQQEEAFAGTDVFAGFEDLPEFKGLEAQSSDADLAALQAFFANTGPAEADAASIAEVQPTDADIVPEAFSLPDEAPETAAAAAAAVSEPEPHTVTVSLEGDAPEVKSVAVEDDPALETDETEVGVQEAKMDEELGLTQEDVTEDRDAQDGLKGLDPKLIEEAGDPFKLMGNASTVAPGAVSSGDATPEEEEEAEREKSEEDKLDPLSVDDGLVLDEVALVAQLGPQPQDEAAVPKEHTAEEKEEEEPKPVSKDFAGDATPAPVDESLLNGEQEQSEDADKTPIAALPLLEEEERAEEQATPGEAKEQTASQQTEVADDEEKTEVAAVEERPESTPSAEDSDERSKSRKRKRLSDEPARPRVTRSASSTTVNGKNGAPKSKGKGKAKAIVEEDEGASDASSALVHGLLDPSSRAGSVSSVDTDDRRPPLVQVDAHTEFIMHQHGRPRAAPTNLPQTIAQAQAAQAQARTKIVATVIPQAAPAEPSRSRAASEEPASEPESPEPAPSTPPMQSASAPPPSTENGAARPAPPRRIPSKNTPVTRANCRFHTISIPREGGGRAQFVVPGCSMGDAKVIKEEDIRDEGFATMADHARMLPDIENLDLDAYLVGNLRKLVGVDLLRENEVFYLPGEEEEPPRKKRRRYARKSTLDRVRTQSGGSKGASQNQSRASTPSGSTDGGSVAGFVRRAGSRSAASSVADGYSTHEEESEAESAAPQPKASRPPVSDAGSQSTSASSVKSPRKRTLSTRRGTRTSRRLNPDAAEFAPGHVEAAQEELDNEDDVAPETRRKRKATRGAKRTRTMEDVPAEGPRPKRTRTNTNLRKSMSVNQVNGKS